MSGQAESTAHRRPARGIAGAMPSMSAAGECVAPGLDEGAEGPRHHEGRSQRHSPRHQHPGPPSPEAPEARQPYGETKGDGQRKQPDHADASDASPVGRPLDGRVPDDETKSNAQGPNPINPRIVVTVTCLTGMASLTPKVWSRGLRSARSSAELSVAGCMSGRWPPGPQDVIREVPSMARGV